jgi:ubiquinone biosynthesis monooxygenase Coq7
MTSINNCLTHDTTNLRLPDSVIADLRTDHAGETGAVCIYKGVLRFARDPALRAFAMRHMQAEQTHLQQIEVWLPSINQSRLLPLWRLSGWLTGALSALFGPRAFYATIVAVETFVDHHYDEQVRSLESKPSLHPLRQTLLACQGEDVAHRYEAAAYGGSSPGFVLRAWCTLVDVGSRFAVSICCHI